MNDTEKLVLVGVGVGLVVVITLVIVGKKAADTAKDALNAINPLNHDNVFATSVNTLGSELTGDPAFTLGGWFYDKTHADPLATPKPTPAPEPVPSIDTPVLY